jgi:hypothetical protein
VVAGAQSDVLNTGAGDSRLGFILIVASWKKKGPVTWLCIKATPHVNFWILAYLRHKNVWIFGTPSPDIVSEIFT